MVKLKKSQLKELIKQAIMEDIMDKEIKNPKTGNMVKIRTALQLPDEHPANKKAKGMIAKAPAPKGRPTKKGSAKDIDKKSMSAADAANAKMDAAEKAAKKKKKGKIKSNPFSKKEVKESKVKRFTVKEVRMWMKKLEENRYKKVYNADARRVSWMANNEGVELSEMPKSMSKKWTKAQYGRERYLATEFVKSKSEQMTEGKLTEKVKYKKDKKIGGKWYTKQGTHKHQMKANVIAKREFGSKHYDAKVVKEKDGYTVYIRPLKEGKLTSEQKLRKVIREILKEQLSKKKIVNEYVGAGKPIPRNKAKYLFVPENQMIRFSRVYKKLIQKGFVYIGDQSKEKKKINKHYTVTIDKKMYNDVLDSLMSKSFKIKT